jgi:hypothetical protein
LRGAQQFRAGQYAAALVEFEVAQRRGGGDEAARYVAATLVKLERFEEAVELFASLGDAGDDLMRWYSAMACHGARLFTCADQSLARLTTGAGPTVSDQAQRVRADIKLLLSSQPTLENIEWYRRRASEASKAGRERAAQAYLAEARALGLRRGEGFGADGLPLAGTRGDAGGASR